MKDTVKKGKTRYKRIPMKIIKATDLAWIEGSPQVSCKPVAFSFIYILYRIYTMSENSSSIYTPVFIACHTH